MARELSFGPVRPFDPHLPLRPGEALAVLEDLRTLADDPLWHARSAHFGEGALVAAELATFTPLSGRSPTEG